MGKLSSVNIHLCELKNARSAFEKLPPNAPYWQQFRRFCRKQISVCKQSAICKRVYRNMSQVMAEKRRHIRSKYFYVVHPYSRFQTFRQILFILVWTTNMTLTPINIAFRYEKPAKLASYHDHMSYIEIYFLVPGQLFYIITEFFCGYVDMEKKTVETDQKKVIKKYICTYFFFDICSIPYPSEKYHTAIHLINLSAYARVFTMLKYLKRTFLDCGVHEHIYRCIKLALVSFGFLHMNACILAYFPMIGYEEYWLDTENMPTEEKPYRAWLVWSSLQDQSMVWKYLGCLNMVQIHFFGFGEGTYRVHDEDYIEMIVLVCVMIQGRLWTLYLTAVLLRVLCVVSISQSKYEDYLLKLQLYMKQKNLPKDLRTRLLDYYEYKYCLHYFNEQVILSALSSYLRLEFILYGARKLISKVHIFKVFPRSIVGMLISKSKQVVYLTNDVIVKAGDPIEYIFFISTGTCAALTREGLELAHLIDGDDIGLIGMLSSSSTVAHAYTYIAIETTELYVIPKKEFRSHIYDKYDVLKYFAAQVEERIAKFKESERARTTDDYDLFGDLTNGKILERSRHRTTYFEK